MPSVNVPVQGRIFGLAPILDVTTVHESSGSRLYASENPTAGVEPAIRRGGLGIQNGFGQLLQLASNVVHLEHPPHMLTLRCRHRVSALRVVITTIGRCSL